MSDNAGRMQIVIIEDYPTLARSLERHVTRLLGARVDSVTIAGGLAEARAALEARPVDLILLDLNLGGRDGFEVLTWAAATGAHTIVVSANTQRAVEAFEYGVLDFVPKPVDPERLGLALARYDRGAEENREKLQWLSVQGRGGYEILPLAEIRRIQAVGKYSEIHLADRPPRIHGKTLERLAALLPDTFTRVHRSHIVNLTRVRRLVVRGGGRYELVLDDEQTVPVGRTRYGALRDRLP